MGEYSVNWEKIHAGKIKWKKRIMAVMLVAGFIVSGYEPILASVIKDAQDKKNEAQQNLNQVNKEIESIHDAQESLQAEMESYDAQLMSLLTDMEILESDIATQEEEIGQANASLEQARLEESRQYGSMKVRIQYMYENSTTSIWASLLESKTITEFLNRVEYITEVYLYDRQMLTDYQDTVQQVTSLAEQLDNEMAEMESLQISFQEQQASLQEVIAAKSAQMEDFDSQLAKAETLASKYAKTIRQQNQIIAAEQKRLEEERKRQEEEKKRKEEEEKQKNEGNSGSSNGLTSGGLNPSYSTNVKGTDVVAYAQQFIGRPYVYGGESLTNGIDCSAFVQQMYGRFGISLPRTSYEQRNVGKAVSYENAQPGDIICYPGHVAIYMGDGRIIHASSPRTGICYGTATYRTITTIRRVL